MSIEPIGVSPSESGQERTPSFSDSKTRDIDATPQQEVITIDWSPDDPQSPQNWSTWRKYSCLVTLLTTTTITAANCTHVAIVNPAGQERFGVDRDHFTLAITLLLIAIAFAPLFLAPLSETLGRNVIYQVTGVVTAAMYIPQALTTNFSGFLAARCFQGMSQSVGNSLVSGTVADMFSPDQRGTPMGLFTLATFLGQTIGGTVFGWVVQELGFQWVYGIQGIAAGATCVLNVLFVRETRIDNLLEKRARELTKKTGIKHVCRGAASKKQGFEVLATSCLRPLKFLVTEPIVSALTTWIAFAWAMIFLGGTSVSLVFAQYGWNTGQRGSAQSAVFIGGLAGYFAGSHQEALYRRAARKNGGIAPPEARLYYAAYGGLCFPIGTYVFAWTGKPSIPWIVPAIALCISNFGIYTIYAGTFTYLADAYETYSSSANAAQSFARNILAAVFPLFAYQFYTGMGYSQAGTLVASVALFLGLAPLILLRYGADLRARSKVASELRREFIADRAEEDGVHDLEMESR
ncbi:major facilitator superfamily domain-containing protein [Papiliotrema laurentii]|uniref:Major facilitator superfamily domain-containing protein n=1 Tax=Papiliotrema laurentii TaxID=5418 RepID=A0AAD9CYL3_PAPLA|nr:major facilitator superfamily domain-containing protein [Papiliotrema laurentii]